MKGVIGERGREREMGEDRWGRADGLDLQKRKESGEEIMRFFFFYQTVDVLHTLRQKIKKQKQNDLVDD